MIFAQRNHVHVIQLIINQLNSCLTSMQDLRRRFTQMRTWFHTFLSFVQKYFLTINTNIKSWVGLRDIDWYKGQELISNLFLDNRRIFVWTICQGPFLGRPDVFEPNQETFHVVVLPLHHVEISPRQFVPLLHETEMLSRLSKLLRQLFLFGRYHFDSSGEAHEISAVIVVKLDFFDVSVY